MYAKFAITALLASNLANAAVLPRGADEFATSLILSEGTHGALVAPAAATTNPVNGLPVSGPQPHAAAPTGTPSGTKKSSKGKGGKNLQQGFIGTGTPGHGQKPQLAAGKPKKSKLGKSSKGGSKKAKAGVGAPKAPAQGGKAVAGGSPEPFSTTPPAAEPTAAPAPTPSSSSVAAPAPSSAPAPKASSAPKAGSGSTSGSGGDMTGDLTFYTPGLGSCGVTNTESDMIVALAEDMMTGSANPNDNPNCGRSITITYKGVSATATIEDTCPGCSGAGLDLTPTLFQKFAPLSEGRLMGATWHFN